MVKSYKHTNHERLIDNKHYIKSLDDLHSYDANAYDQLYEIIDSICFSAEVEGVKLDTLKRQIKSGSGIWFDELISSMNYCLEDNYEVADYYGPLCNNDFRKCDQLKQDASKFIEQDV